MDPFIGQIILVPYDFAPRGWALCNGQLLQISVNTALFSLLGTTYGGDGIRTFALPDLRGRVPVSSGQAPGLSPYTLGMVGGTETVILNSNQMPGHSHAVNANSAHSNSEDPANNFPASSAHFQTSSDGTKMNAAMIGQTGSSQPHENRQPYLTLNYCIALEGIYPSRG